MKRHLFLAFLFAGCLALSLSASNYPGTANSVTLSPAPPQILAQNDQALVFNVENPSTPQASVAFKLPVEKGEPTAAIEVDIDFPSNPGAANIQIQGASFDADAYYLTPTNSAYTITTFTQKGSIYTASTSLAPFGYLYGRVLLSANPNNLGVRVRVTRIG